MDTDKTDTQENSNPRKRLRRSIPIIVPLIIAIGIAGLMNYQIRKGFGGVRQDFAIERCITEETRLERAVGDKNKVFDTSEIRKVLDAVEYPWAIYENTQIAVYSSDLHVSSRRKKVDPSRKGVYIEDNVVYIPLDQARKIREKTR